MAGQGLWPMAGTDGGFESLRKFGAIGGSLLESPCRRATARRPDLLGLARFASSACLRGWDPGDTEER